MSQQTNEVIEASQQIITGPFIVQMATVIVTIAIAFSSLRSRVSTLEQLRIEDQNRLDKRLDDIQASLQRIADWQLQQNKQTGD